MMGDAYFEITRGVGQTLPEKNASIVCNELEPSALETALEEIRSEAVPALKKLSAGLDSWTDLGTELGDASRQLHQLIARMDNIASGVEQGEGTVGRLLVDRTVADELEQLLSKSVASMDELKLILDNIRQASTNFPAITESVHQSAQDLPAVLAQAQHTLQEIERLARGMQRHWLLRGAVRQADADAAASNQTTRAKTP
jgi:phospholipid/cholesterol/gamma-HCH transport system substrate-binding protein